MATTTREARRPGAIPGAILPGAPGWDDARRAWNLAVDQRPQAIVFPESREQVAAAVTGAREAGLRVAVQGTGHGAGSHTGLEGALIVNTGRMRGVTIDAASRTARVAAGALWQDVVPGAAAHGLAALHGSAPDVGVVGYTLGGGLGWLARHYGLACNSVIAIELVMPDGTHARVDRVNDPELFWALRGGGGNFGVVTALEFALYPVATVHAGWLAWPWERSAEVLETWAHWTETVPDKVTSVGRILQLPPLPELPEQFRGRQLAVVEAAMMLDEDRSRRLLAPLRALGPEIDTFATVPASRLATLHMDPPEPVPFNSDAALIDTLPDEAVEAFVACSGPDSGSPLLSVELRHLGGALGRVRSGAGALANLRGEYALFAVGLSMTPEMGAAIEEHASAVAEALSPWSSGRQYLNFADRPTDPNAVFEHEAIDRLRGVRRRLDPDGLMLANHPIARAD